MSEQPQSRIDMNNGMRNWGYFKKGYLNKFGNVAHKKSMKATKKGFFRKFKPKFTMSHNQSFVIMAEFLLCHLMP